MEKNSTRYQALLFDLDGTVIDSRKGIMHCLKNTMLRCGIDPEGRDLLQYIGPPIGDIFMDITGDAAMTQQAIGWYRECYSVTGVHENTLLPGIAEAIRTLHKMGYRILLATSKPQKFAKIILEDFGLLEEFEYVGGASLDGSVSTKLEVIHSVLEHCHLSEQDALMIGDRKFDLIGAQQAHMDAMGILFGFGTKEELSAYPNIYLAPTAQDIVRYLAR